jgi:hypothetical protein
MVQPAPQPFSLTTATASTSGWSGSGVTPPASGSGSGTFFGPHYVEEQSLSINYVRVPRGKVDTDEISLTDASATYKVVSTKLACIITANYSRRKVDSIFSTSSYQQPQKFEWVGVSADADGYTYGSLNASTLGPVGDIITTQPWYYRRAWDDTTDTEVVSSVIVASFGYGTSSSSDYISSNNQDTAYSRLYDKWLLRPEYSYTPLSDYDRWPINSDSLYTLYGPYATDQESLVKIVELIDTVGNRLSAEDFYAIPANTETINPGTGGEFTMFKKDTGLPFYSTHRHDYS